MLVIVLMMMNVTMRAIGRKRVGSKSLMPC